MTSVDADSPQVVSGRIEWLAPLAGLLVLYVPTLTMLATRYWPREDHAHGPIILGIALWLAWKARAALSTQSAAPLPGLAVLVFGLLLYVVGRSQAVTLFEVGSLIPVTAGALLAMRGWSVLRAFWFPILFLSFAVPLPGFIVDAGTEPLRLYIAAIAEHLLYLVGYPVARAGAVVSIGPYQLLVNEACAGLNSMFSLLAVGALYLYLMRHPGKVHNAVILASLLPIAFLSNLGRVLILALITYYLGDAAGQGFLHRFAGMVLFAAALALILALDAALMRAIPRRKLA